MSPHKLRKTRKLRGSRTVGWGQVGQHRNHSQRGGRKVGRHKHLWTYVIKYEPNYFGKKGFSYPESLRQKTRAINIGQLDELIEKLTREKQLMNKEGKSYVDLEALGYHKLLAAGKLTNAVIVNVELHSENAARKIKEAGGKILVRSLGKGEVVKTPKD